MSRIGKQPIKIPEKVEVKIDGGNVSVKGPGGELSRSFGSEIGINAKDGMVILEPKRKDKDTMTLWGTYASLISNMLDGAAKPFEKKLIIEGIGYKMEVKGSDLVMSLGFSHPVVLKIPQGIKITIDKNVLTAAAINKELLGEFVAKVRDQKKPEPYKGKGFRYSNEVIRRKQGKKTA